jgi:hypothetical protein
MIGCAYCGKRIGNDNNHSIEFFGLWNHIKNKHWKEINPVKNTFDTGLRRGNKL